MDETPTLMIKGNLLAHRRFTIAIKEDAFSGEKAELLAVVAAMLPNLRPNQFYEMLAGMGRPVFETYFSIAPDPDAPPAQEVDVDELWERIAQQQAAGLL